MPAVKSTPVWTRVDLFICLALFGVTTAVFWQVSHHEFITYDDPNYVTENLRVQAGLTKANLAWAFQTTSASNWHPLTWLSHMLDCQWFGLHAGPHHLVNVFFHVLNSVLLFAVFKKMTGARWPSAFVAALFALHPLHVESVAWVAERKDVLSAFFWILTVWAYAGYVERPRLWRYGLALLFFALGLMSKPMVVTLPCVLLLLDFWPLGRMQLASKPSANPRSTRSPASAVRRPLHRSVLYPGCEKIPFLLLTAASSIVTYLAQQKGEAVVTVAAVPIAQRLANATIAYVRYAGKTIWPDNLAVFYPYVRVWPAWEVAGAALMLIGMTLLVFRLRNRSYLAMGWLWYLGTLVPVIGLIQVGGQSMADRYTYVPLIGLFVMIAWGAADLAERWRWSRMALAVSAFMAVSVCLVATIFQVQFWKSSLTLFEHALSVSGGSATIHFNLGYALLARGRTEDALTHFAAGLQRDPRAYWVYGNIGDILLGQGKTDEAITTYRKGLQIHSESPQLNNNLGLALGRQQNFSEAARYYASALQLKPDYLSAHLNLGNALLALGKLDQAVAQFYESLRLNPDCVEALNNLAWIRATDQNAALRNGAEAVRCAERACELTGRQQAFPMGTLAAAYAEAGRYVEAVSTAQKAAQLATAAGQKEIAATNQKLLDLYRTGKPYRDIPGERK